IPGYTMERTIGKGGFGTVFLAHSERLESRVAIKVIDRDLGPDWVNAIRRRAQKLLRLRHPAIVSTYEVGFVGDLLYIAMEFVERITVAESMRGQAMDPFRIADIVARIADGIQSAHTQDLVHHDLKAANILIDQDGRPRIGDFGLDPTDVPAGHL